MKIEVVIPYTIQPTPDEVKAKIETAKEWELLDPDGMRYSFNDTEQGAKDALHDLVYDMLVSSNFEMNEGE